MKYVKLIFVMNILLKGGCMKRHRFAFATILIAIAVCVFFFSGCALVEPKAEVTITSTVIDEDFGDWYMDIYFTIVNTGLYNIVSYDITFTVTCTDDTLVNGDEYWGSYLARGESYSDVWRVYTYSKEPSTAHVSNLVLESE
jgi:hypothetical protein